MLTTATMKTNSQVDINSRSNNHAEALGINFEGAPPSNKNLKRKPGVPLAAARYSSLGIQRSEPARTRKQQSKLIIQPPVFEKYKVVNRTAHVSGQELWYQPHKST